MFLYIGKNHPNWLIFFRGVQTTNQLCSFWFILCVCATIHPSSQVISLRDPRNGQRIIRHRFFPRSCHWIICRCRRRPGRRKCGCESHCHSRGLVTRSILHGYLLILTSLLVLMGISTFTSKEFVIFCRVSKIGNGKLTMVNHRSIPPGKMMENYWICHGKVWLF